MATHLEDRRTTPPPPAGRSGRDVGDVWPRLISTAFGAYLAAARFINTALAIWLALSTLIIVHLTPITIWNNLIVAVAVFIVSLIPSRTPGMPHRRGRYAEV